MDRDEASQLYDVKFVQNVLIPARDGTRLAADLHLPVGDGQFPAILTVPPYRKDDASKLASFPYYFAQRGYVHCRLAMLGRAEEAAAEYAAAAGLIQQLTETIEDAELKRGFLSNPEVSSIIAATNQPMRKEQ